MTQTRGCVCKSVIFTGSCRGGVRGSFSSFTAASLHVLSSIHDGINPCSVPCFPASFSPGLTECYVTILHHLLLSVSSASLFLSYPNSITLSFAVSFLCLTLFHPSYHCTSLQNPPPPLPQINLSVFDAVQPVNSLISTVRKTEFKLIYCKKLRCKHSVDIPIGVRH